MTLNGNFALKSVSGLATDGLASPAFGQNCSKICRAKYGKSTGSDTVPCSPGNVLSGSLRFMQIFAGVPWGGGRRMRVWSLKIGDFRFFRSLSSEHFTYMATRQPLHDATVDDLGDISLFH